MNDAARSAKQNIREGYRKNSAGEFGRYIKISAGSMEELEGDVDDCFEDGLIIKDDYDKLKDIFGKTKYQNTI
ncbi:MAG: four helix bundle protein [Bacteroidota bacterium]|nr:four helix bundle protein [Bacteroidota bacterium]